MINITGITDFTNDSGDSGDASYPGDSVDASASADSGDPGNAGDEGDYGDSNDSSVSGDSCEGVAEPDRTGNSKCSQPNWGKYFQSTHYQSSIIIIKINSLKFSRKSSLTQNHP